MDTNTADVVRALRFKARSLKSPTWQGVYDYLADRIERGEIKVCGKRIVIAVNPKAKDA